VWAYNLDKELELQDQHDELKEYKKKKRAHIQEVVNASMLSEQEKEWMQEYLPQVTADITYNNNENRYEERITMPNLFDMRAKRLS
jgi:hypothetical protein